MRVEIEIENNKRKNWFSYFAVVRFFHIPIQTAVPPIRNGNQIDPSLSREISFHGVPFLDFFNRFIIECCCCVMVFFLFKECILSNKMVGP